MEQCLDKKIGAHFTSMMGGNCLTPDVIAAFQGVIYQHYRQHARQFPWRMTDNPYHILVSEMMLQQTQTDRVLEKYEPFLRAFPDFPSLAKAPLKEVLKVWQGLGYNRRALALKKIAQRVEAEFHGNLPSRVEVLMTFPGIGKTTSSAVVTFAFNKPTVFIETNIRRVFIHFFFQNQANIKDSEMLPVVEKMLDASHPRQWYYALMDYGAMLKNKNENPNRRSAHYRKQARFQDSNRQIRGMILKALITQSALSEAELVQKLKLRHARVKPNLIQLQKEGFIRNRGNRFLIA
ncbi:MAG: A/G-specific adenine glycosylase [Candidatus Aminicenantes bacterium]|nr:A/G-specific adenine glycosylase [Candidatus Aminicenantes bacterium]MDH5714949.1 A/G-specific adenine glycosylase [Candidatus Aminicenantes bacterium]